MTPEQEVAIIHREIFGSPPKPALVAFYAMAHERNSRLTTLSKEEKNVVALLVARNVSLVAAEFWWRKKAPENALSVKLYLTCLLNESIEGYARSQPPLSFFATIIAAVRDLVKLIRARIKMKKHGFL